MVRPSQNNHSAYVETKGKRQRPSDAEYDEEENGEDVALLAHSAQMDKDGFAAAQGGKVSLTDGFFCGLIKLISI